MNAFIKNLTGIQPILGLEHAKSAMEKAQGGERRDGGQPPVLRRHQLPLRTARAPGPQTFSLLVMAGPKVYQDLSAVCRPCALRPSKWLSPPSRASGGAEVSMRDLAEITRKVMKDAEEYQAQGRILYFFPEGSRTRSGAMEAFIPASARYCDQDNTTVYPVGFAGTDGLVGVDSNAIHVEQPYASALELPSPCLRLATSSPIQPARAAQSLGWTSSDLPWPKSYLPPQGCLWRQLR